MPIWPVTSLGDTGNGYLSAIGIVQALYHRDRTGEGQFVDTVDPVRAPAQRVADVGHARRRARGDRAAARRDADRLDRAATGCTRPPTAGCASPRVTDAHLDALAGVARPRRCRPDDADLGAELATAFAARPAASGSTALDAAGVPARGVDPDFVLSLFDDPEMVEKGWVTSYEHPIVGRMDAARAPVRPLRHARARRRARRSSRARTPARSSPSSATTDAESRSCSPPAS